MERKERILGFDLIRAVCALIIIWYHIACTFNAADGWAKDPLFYNYANGNWGEITVVSVFFMLSGASLYYRYREMSSKDIPEFYKKRWLSLFPSFLLVWFFLYLGNVLKFRNFFYAGDWKHLIPSFFGMDGYFLYRFPTYYLIGEWFLGAIVLLYLLYPLVLFIYRKAKWACSALLFAALIFVIYSDVFLIPAERNLITCLAAMWMGMLLCDHMAFIGNKIFCIISMLMAAVLLFVRIPLPSVISMLLMGACIFVILLKTSDVFLKKDIFIYKVVRFISDESYQIFLLQHVVITGISSYFAGLTLGHRHELALAAFITILVIFYARILLIVNNRIVSWIKELKMPDVRHLQNK